MDRKKYSKEYMDSLAASRGGRCLSEEYGGVSKEYEWECKGKHRWTTTLGNIIYNSTWCRECYLESKYGYSMDDLLEIANDRNAVLKQRSEDRNGLCLWLCEKGHLVNETPSKFKRKGCSECREPRSLGVEEVCKRAKEINFEFTGEEFKGIDKIYNWVCVKCDEVKRSSFKNLYYGKKGCSACEKEKENQRRILKITKTAENKGYKVVEFLSHYPLYECVLLCKEGHLRKGNEKMLRTKSKCAECMNEKKKKYGIEDARAIAEKRKGYLISEKFDVENLEWMCEKGDKWTANFYNVLNGTWCPECSKKSGKRGRPKKKAENS